jgi:hypothetical protein
MKSSDEITDLYIELNNRGLEQVEIQLAQGIYGNPKKKLVENWVKTQKEALDNQHKDKGIAIAKEANQLAKKSNHISKWSLLVSILALTISALVAIFGKT